MTYNLEFHPDALKEWKRLPASDQKYFKKKLAQRLDNPHITGARLSGGQKLYKNKRKRPPLRLTYYADDQVMVVIALSIGKRDAEGYREMHNRHMKGDS